jgi:UDP-N-acetylglucosamine diphosphorylase/glucosamine-1-phosphate N-acetyltransferase
MSLVFVDDNAAGQFSPFALTRPVCELRAGAVLVRRRWEMALREETLGFIAGPHLADFEEPWAGAPGFVDGIVPAGSIVVQSRCAISLAANAGDADLLSCDGRIAAVRLESDVHSSRLLEEGLAEVARRGGREVSVRGWWLDHVWEVVRHLSEMLTDDIPLLAAARECKDHRGANVIGPYPVFTDQGASVEALAVCDASNGPIMIGNGATVQSFTRLVGPCFIGENTQVKAGQITASAIGEQCRVNGELSNTVMIGHANKSHDGFIGHSVLGRWVNLGAGTVNSNLKNTYGTVALEAPSGSVDTGMQFLGTFFGDHAKTAIGTRLNTGCVIGAGANVFGSGTVPKSVSPFAWGLDGNEFWDLERFLRTAERVMARRNVSLGERARRQLATAWHLRSGGGDGRGITGRGARASVSGSRP